MGEKIKDLISGSICGEEFRIELNESQNSMDDYDIHLETPNIRLALRDDEFMKMVFQFMEAKRKILNTKDFRED